MGVFTDDSPQNDTPIRKTGVFTDGPRQIHAAVRKISLFTDGKIIKFSHPIDLHLLYHRHKAGRAAP